MVNHVNHLIAMGNQILPPSGDLLGMATKGRKPMLRKILAGAVATLLTCSMPVRADELKLAHFMSPQHPMDRFVMTPLAERVAAASGGDLTIEALAARLMVLLPQTRDREAIKKQLLE